jgi:hypothetical protein
MFGCLAALPRVPAAQDTFTGVDRIVAIGDVHGDYAQFVTILHQAGVIDSRSRWSGGRTHLVQTGDVLDRGPDSRKVMELLMALTPQAARAGGRVHALIGNHEVMNIVGDLRYVSAGEYKAFADAKSSALRNRAFAVLSDSTRRDDPAYRQEWEARHPLGWVEHRFAFEANGRYGTWIRGNNAAVRLGDYLFVHGGIGPKYANTSLVEINKGVREVIAVGAQPVEGNIAEDAEGPLWYRGLVLDDEALLASHVDTVLSRFGVKHLVVGHSVTAGTVMPRFGGKVIAIDVGLSASYGGPPACLIIEGGKAFTLHRGQRLTLPMNDENLLPYLKAAAALDPQPSKLQALIDQLAIAR